ncbi:MAG: inorganic phosphate transporter [Bacteroidales bacterium]|nr:inorganic phosphate transporter [Bacteroidales bacterium]
MENIYIVLVGVLFILAISDLVVGVSNDAVNFLNSAVGSKAAPFKVIMLIAALGILFGTIFSSGMMEIARKGIFHPQYFYFSEIMIIFLAVMVTDVLLLDMFNTFGLPTSTTVSIVFELLGAAVAVAIYKISTDPNGAMQVGEYINSEKALAIIAGILLSVIIAFTIGALVQYLVRIVFSFNYKKTLKNYGAIWGGIAISAITYFILIKGVKGAAFMSDNIKELITENTIFILGISFIGWTVLLQLLSWLFKLNILKLIVLVGTFALAMAFAGNDLVNFIGVPLAGLASFNEFIKELVANPGTDPNSFLMTALQGKTQTPTLLLILAGLIMVITLWFSRKAKGVMKTEIDLGRQNEGAERFGSSAVSRSIVRSSLNLGKAVSYIIPNTVTNKISKRFRPVETLEDADSKSFDLVRASVNLVVASIIISFATSLKLPLSTTYVTFMVAMGTSLADKAWGRESAVYRITGVLSVIGGWFFTAFSAFVVAFLLALLFSWGGFITIGIMVIIAFFIIFKTQAFHKKREENQKATESSYEITGDNIVEKCSTEVVDILFDISVIYKDIFQALINEDIKKLREINKRVDKINKHTKRLKDNTYKTIHQLNEDLVETGHFYVQVLDYLREIAHCITFIVQPSLEHVDNNHKGLIPEQIAELNFITKGIDDLIKIVNNVIKNDEFSDLINVLHHQRTLLAAIEEYRKKQIRRIKYKEAGTKNSMLYITILAETKNLLLNTINLVKSQRDFIIYNNSKNDTN